MKKTTLAIIGFLFITAFTACAQTEVVQEIPLEESEQTPVSNGLVIGRDADGLYTQEANAIVIGTVESIATAGGEPYTEATVTVEEVLKGDENLSTVTVEVQNPLSSLWVEDAATLFEGQRVLLFLGTDSEGNYVIFAGDFGKYVIDKNEEVTSVGDFKMSLDEVKAKIEAAL